MTDDYPKHIGGGMYKVPGQEKPIRGREAALQAMGSDDIKPDPVPHDEATEENNQEAAPEAVSSRGGGGKILLPYKAEREWKDMTLYECRSCPYSTVRKDMIQAHVTKHAVQPLPPERPQIVKTDRFGNPVGNQEV